MLGRDVAVALPHLRDHAESNMRDTCTVTAPGAVGAWDENTGTYAHAPDLTLYAGKCRVRMPNQAERESISGDADWTVSGVIVALPVAGTAAIPVGATVTITACEMDPGLVGQPYRVAGPHAQSQATARRLRCVAVSRG